MTVALILYKFSLVQIITTFKQYQTTFRLKGHEKKINESVTKSFRNKISHFSQNACSSFLKFLTNHDVAEFLEGGGYSLCRMIDTNEFPEVESALRLGHMSRANPF